MRYVCGCKMDARFLVFAIPYNRTLIAMLRCLIKYSAMDLLSENELLAGILLHGVRANQPTSQPANSIVLIWHAAYEVLHL